MPRNTKERILHETLSAFGVLRFEDISLSTIAARVGISKTAIFRHFKNKQELFDELDRQVVGQLSELKRRLSSTDMTAEPNVGSKTEAFVILAHFFSERPELLPYLLQMTFTGQHGTVSSMMLDVLKLERDLSLVEDRFDVSTMCFFLRQMVCSYDGDEELIGRYASAVSRLVESGFSCFSDIPLSRMDELDEIARVTGQETTQDRFFLALGRVMDRFGPFGISVERVADELGLANSTIYATYESKDEMIRQTVIKEFLNYSRALSSRLAAADSLSEAVYLMLSTSASYSSRSIPLSDYIICWISMNGNLDCGGEDFERFDFHPVPNRRLENYYQEFRACCGRRSIDPELISRWILFLPFRHFFVRQILPESTLTVDSVRSLYRLICGGLEGVRRMER